MSDPNIIKEELDKAISAAMEESAHLFKKTNIKKTIDVSAFKRLKNIIRAARLAIKKVEILSDLNDFCEFLYKEINSVDLDNIEFTRGLEAIRVKYQAAFLEAVKDSSKPIFDNKIKSKPALPRSTTVDFTANIEAQSSNLPSKIQTALNNCALAIELQDYQEAKKLFSTFLNVIAEEDKATADLWQEMESNLTARIQATEANIQNVTAQLDQLKATEQTWATQAEIAEKQKQAVAAELKKEQALNQPIIEELSVTTEELKVANINLAELTLLKNKLETDLSVLRQLSTGFQTKITALQEENQNLKYDVTRLNKQLNEAKSAQITTQDPDIISAQSTLAVPQNESFSAEQLAAQAAHELTLLADAEKLLLSFTERLQTAQGLTRQLQAALCNQKQLQRELAEEKEQKQLLLQELVLKNAEISALQARFALLAEKNPSPANLNNLPAISKEDLQQKLTKLQELADDIGQLSIRIMEWLKDTHAKKNMEFGKLRLLVNQAEKTLIDQKEKLFESKLAVLEQQQQNLENLLAQIEQSQAALKQYLRAVEIIENGLPSTKILYQDLNPALKEQTVQALMGELEQLLLETPNPSSPAVVINQASPLLPKITAPSIQLPFSIEVTPVELAQVRQYETQFTKFQHKSADDLVGQIPFKRLTTSYAKEKTRFDDLINNLQSSNFLKRLKMAIVVLGALRHDQEFKAYTLPAVYLAVRSAISSTTSFVDSVDAITWPIAQIYILGEWNPDFHLIERKQMPSERGESNYLTLLGQSASKVWTEDLLSKKIITEAQLTALSYYITNKTE